MSDIPTQYFEHLITIRVLANRDIGPIGDLEDLAVIARECFSADFVGELVSHEPREVCAAHMAEMLNAAGSEPGFFGIRDAQELASDLHDSASIEGCSPDLIVVERKAYNNLLIATGLAAYAVPEAEEVTDG